MRGPFLRSHAVLLSAVAEKYGRRPSDVAQLIGATRTDALDFDTAVMAWAGAEAALDMQHARQKQG